MTRKDYELIAKVLKEAREDSESGEEKLRVRLIAAKLADEFSDRNERFDRNRFFKACGII